MAEFTTDINKIYSENNILTHLPEKYYDNYLYLLVRDPYYIFSYWELTDETKNSYLNDIGPDAKLTLRVFKGIPEKHHEIFTDIHNIWDIGSYHIIVNAPNTTFFIRLGYLKDNKFYPLMTSNVVTTPRDTYSDVLDEEWMAREEYYRGLRKLSFDTHGSPFVRGQKSVMLSSKIERVSSDFLKQETSNTAEFSEEITPLHPTETETTEYGEEAIEELSRTYIKKGDSFEENEVLHPKTKENISKPPDKVTEEPVEETHVQEIRHNEEARTKPVAAKPQKAVSAVIKKMNISGYEVTPALKIEKKPTKTAAKKNTPKTVGANSVRPEKKKTTAKAKTASVKKTPPKATAVKKVTVKAAVKTTAVKKTTVKKATAKITDDKKTLTKKTTAKAVKPTAAKKTATKTAAKKTKKK